VENPTTFLPKSHGGLVLQRVTERSPEFSSSAYRTDTQLSRVKAILDFGHNKIFIGQGWVRGRETDLKTSGSYREIDMLPTVAQALATQRAGI
jgi:hypothetical protein